MGATWEVGIATDGYEYHILIFIHIIKIHSHLNEYITFDSSSFPQSNGYIFVLILISFFLLFQISIEYF